MALSDTFVILITLCIDFFIILYCIYDLYANRRAFNSVREIIFRLLIPVLITVFYQIPYFIVGYNAFSLLILLQLFVNMLIAVLLWESEAFLGVTLDLEKIGRIWIYLHFYFEDSQKMEVNLYKWPDDSTDLETLVKVIDEFKVFERDKKQFELEEDYREFLEAKKNYESWKKNAKDYKIDCYSYYDFTEKWRGFKRLYYVNKLGIIGKKIEGNCIFLPETIPISHRKFKQIICWEGFRERMISQELEITKMILKTLTYLSELEEIPLLKEELKKKDKILELQRDTIQNIEDDYYIANIKTPKGEMNQYQASTNKWFRNLFALITLILGLFVAVILLMVFGII